jgi:hypothetical protein
MNLLLKHPRPASVISLSVLLAGTAMCVRELKALPGIFQKGIRADGEITSALHHAMTMNAMMVALGSGAVALGIAGLVLSLMAWIQNAPPGSRLTLHGWSPASQLTEAEISVNNAWSAIAYGAFGTMGWIVPLCIEAFRSLPFSSSLVTLPVGLTLLLGVISYGVGISLCWRRDRHAAATAQGPWTFAFILNFGGLFVFLFAASTLFLVHSHI